MESLARWREPAAVVLLITLAVRLVWAVVNVLGAAEVYDSFADAAMAEGTWAADPLLVVGSAVVAIACARPQPTPHAQPLMILALVGCALLVAVSLTFGVIGLVGSSEVGARDLLELLTVLVLPLMACVALVVVLRAWPAGSHQPALGPVPEQVDAPQQQLSTRPQYPASWRPEEASGAAWLTADDAASGAPAAGWGTEDAGWNPIPGRRDAED